MQIVTRLKTNYEQMLNVATRAESNWIEDSWTI